MPQEENAQPSNFSARLRKLMDEQGFSQHRLADLLETTQSTVRGWLNGASPRERMEALLAEALNVNAHWLRTGEGSPAAGSPRTKGRSRLKEARVRKGLSKGELAKRVGYSIATYQEIEDGRSQMGEKMARRVAEELGVPVEDLIDGSDEPPSRNVPIGTFGAVPDIKLPPGMTAKYVPLISMAQCGAMKAYTDEIYSHEGFLAFNVNDPSAFAVRLAGDSMMPRIEPGDVAVVSPRQHPKNGGVVLAKLNVENGEDVMLKLYNASGDMITLSSYNPAYPPMTYPRSAFQWIYPVSQVTRSL